VKLKINDNGPNFVLPSTTKEKFSLKDSLGKYIVIYFYPKDDTPGCTAEACDLRDNYHMWLEKGYAVVGISPDGIESHQKFATKYTLPFPLIADPEKEIIKAYGAWGLKKLYGREYEGLLRMTFVIDQQGVIKQIFDKVKTKEHTQQILKTL